MSLHGKTCGNKGGFSRYFLQIPMTDCIMRLARECNCKRVRTATDNTEKTIKTGIFLRWELHYFTKMTDL